MATAAYVVMAAAAAYGAHESRESRKDQEKAIKKSEAVAEEALEEQEDLAKKEKKEADAQLEKARARMIKSQQGRGGLLFGSETGTEDTTTSTQQTLGV